MSPATDLSEQIAKEMGFPGVVTAVNPLRPDDQIVNRQLGAYPPTCPVCERFGVTIFLYPTNSNPKGDLLFECLNAVGAIGAGHWDGIWRRGTNTWEPVPWNQRKDWEPPTLVKVDGKKTKKIKGAKGSKGQAAMTITIVDKTKAKVSPPKRGLRVVEQTYDPRSQRATVMGGKKKAKAKHRIKLGVDPTAFDDRTPLPPSAAEQSVKVDLTKKPRKK